MVRFSLLLVVFLAQNLFAGKAPIWSQGSDVKVLGTGIVDKDGTYIAPLVSSCTDGHVVIGSAAATYGYDCQAEAGASGLSNVVEDTTPQLGGDLDLNSSDITGTGNYSTTGTLTISGALSSGDISGNDLTVTGSVGVTNNADQVALGVKANGTQTGNILEIFNASGVVVSGYNSTGKRFYTNANGNQFVDCETPLTLTEVTANFQVTSADHCVGFVDSTGATLVGSTPSHATAANIGTRFWVGKMVDTGGTMSMTGQITGEKVNGVAASFEVMENIGLSRCEVVDNGAPWGTVCVGGEQ